jgi:hypothetical protein
MQTARLTDSQTSNAISSPGAVGEAVIRPCSLAPTIEGRMRLMAEKPADTTQSVRGRGILVLDESSRVRDWVKA